MRPRLHWVANLSALILLSLFGLSSPASADSGDGLVGCNVGEICVAKDATSANYIKHFYWTANHTGYTYWNVSAGTGTSINVAWSASQFANRDTECNIRIYDSYGNSEVWNKGDSTYHSWLYHFTMKYPLLGAPGWSSLAYAWNDENVSHARC